MSRVFVTGDTHGGHDIRKLTRRQFSEQKDLTKDDFVIILGDFAVPWFSFTRISPEKWTGEDKYWLDWYNLKNFTTLFVDGNHDNHPALASFPVVEWHGGKVHKLADSVYHLMRGQVYEINGKKFFVMGGATSVDKHTRTEGISWWPEEIPSYQELEEGMVNLEKVNFEVDYVLSHCCATTYASLLLKRQADPDTLTSFFEHLETDFNLKYNHWYFGHYHQDTSIGSKHTCLYNTIVEVTKDEYKD